MSEPFDQAQQSVEEAMLELRSCLLTLEQLVPDQMPKFPSQEVRWPWLLSRMTERVDEALTVYFEQVRLVLRARSSRRPPPPPQDRIEGGPH